ncbi:MAG: hypothetical protein AAGB05_10855 [Pseudomonadota bacterium]
METIGKLVEESGRYEYRCDRTGMIVRGDHPEWVLTAAAELLTEMAKREMDSAVEEAETLVEFGECTEIELDNARWKHKARFEIIPQCMVIVGGMEYRWVSPEATELRDSEFDGQPMKRLHDMSLTRSDSFLRNEPGVPASSEG